MPDAPALTTADLARLVHGTLEGDAGRVIRDVATLDVAGPGDVAWLADDRLMDKFRATRAGAVLVPTDLSDVSGKTVIRVSDPDLALCTVLEALAPEVRRLPEAVHPDARVSVRAQVGGACIAANAQVGANTVIGEGTQVHPGVYIGDNCRIGRDCVIWPNVVIRERTTLGDRVIIHPNATIGADGFGYLQRGGRHVKIPQIGRVVIEDDVEIGAGSCIDRARSGVTRIGRGTKIDNLVQIAHNVQIGEGGMIVGQVGIGGSAKLGRYVVIGGQSGVVDHVTVGDRAVFAAQSLAASDVAPGEVMRGSPCVHYQQFARETVAVRRLPKLIEEVRKLRKRVEELESTANH